MGASLLAMAAWQATQHLLRSGTPPYESVTPRFNLFPPTAQTPATGLVAGRQCRLDPRLCSRQRLPGIHSGQGRHGRQRAIGNRDGHHSPPRRKFSGCADANERGQWPDPGNPAGLSHPGSAATGAERQRRLHACAPIQRVDPWPGQQPGQRWPGRQCRPVHRQRLPRPPRHA